MKKEVLHPLDYFDQYSTAGDIQMILDTMPEWSEEDLDDNLMICIGLTKHGFMVYPHGYYYDQEKKEYVVTHTEAELIAEHCRKYDEWNLPRDDNNRQFEKESREEWIKGKKDWIRKKGFNYYNLPKWHIKKIKEEGL